MTTATNAWMDYVERAVASIYPNLRPGYDFTWGRRPLPVDAPEGTPLEDPSMLHWSDKLQAADMGAIQAKAQEYADTDPQARQEPEAPPVIPGGTQQKAEGIGPEGTPPGQGGTPPGQEKPRAEQELPGTDTDAAQQGRVEPSTAGGENYGHDVDAQIEGEGSPVQRTEEDERREQF
jgi:hypothetical protein